MLLHYDPALLRYSSKHGHLETSEDQVLLQQRFHLADIRGLPGNCVQPDPFVVLHLLLQHQNYDRAGRLNLLNYPSRSS